MCRVIEALSRSIPRRIEAEQGLAYFVSRRLQFEGWLKVIVASELGKYLISSNSLAQVEVEHPLGSSKERVDLVVPELLALELKVITTNYTAVCVEHKSKNITNQVDGLRSDLEKLRRFVRGNPVDDAAILGVAFPVGPGSIERWKQQHINKLLPSLPLEYTEWAIKLPCLEGIAPGLLFTLRLKGAHLSSSTPAR